MPDVPSTLYHYTSAGVLARITAYGYIKCAPCMPPRWLDRRGDYLPTVIYLSASDLRGAQRWAGVPDSGVRGISYLDRAAGRIALNLSPEFGPMPQPFRKWAVARDIPSAYVEEAAKGSDVDLWWVLEREVGRDEWQEFAFWDGLRYRPTFTRIKADAAPWPRGR